MENETTIDKKELETFIKSREKDLAILEKAKEHFEVVKECLLQYTYSDDLETENMVSVVPYTLRAFDDYFDNNLRFVYFAKTYTQHILDQINESEKRNNKND